MTKLELKDTTTYPTRYKAYDNPRILGQQTNIPRKVPDGFEYAFYYESAPNRLYPDDKYLRDGIYVRISDYQWDYLVEGAYFVIAPPGPQPGIHQLFKHYGLAMHALIAFMLRCRPVAGSCSCKP